MKEEKGRKTRGSLEDSERLPAGGLSCTVGDFFFFFYKVARVLRWSDGSNSDFSVESKQLLKVAALLSRRRVGGG